MKMNPAAVSLGRKGGKATSPAKAKAARENIVKANAARAAKGSPRRHRCDACNELIGHGVKYLEASDGRRVHAECPTVAKTVRGVGKVGRKGKGKGK